MYRLVQRMNNKLDENYAQGKWTYPHGLGPADFDLVLGHFRVHDTRRERGGGKVIGIATDWWMH
jgi:hypothetical protein